MFRATTSPPAHAAEAPTFPRLSTDGTAWSKPSNGPERRRRLRRIDHRGLKLFDPVTGSYMIGRTRDTSDTGMCVELPDRVPARQGETAFVHLADGRGLVQRSGMMPVRYAWVRRIGKTLTCGLEILAASDTIRRAA
ncbi:MAG: hypothetical protein AAGI46_07040 [Planctomycetota bacterium]